MKYYFIILFIFIYSIAHSLKAPTALKDPVSALLNFPESERFINSVEKQGPIKIVYAPFPEKNLTALWEADTRTIYINKALPYSKGRILSSILFEMHNAASTQELERLYNLAFAGQITKEEFVRQIEMMEHRNGIMAKNLLLRGIYQGYFPENCQLHYFDSFEDYYAIQQVFGHSQWIADRFDEASPLPKKPYKGTIGDLALNTREDKLLFLDLISFKNDPENRDLNVRLDWLSERYAHAQHHEIALINSLFADDLNKHPLYFCKAKEIVTDI